jgi:hypothetical protein
MQLAGMPPLRSDDVHVRTSSRRPGDSDERAAYVLLYVAPDFTQLRHALANRKSCRNLLFTLERVCRPKPGLSLARGGVRLCNYNITHFLINTPVVKTLTTVNVETEPKLRE